MRHTQVKGWWGEDVDLRISPPDYFSCLMFVVFLHFDFLTMPFVSFPSKQAVETNSCDSFGWVHLRFSSGFANLDSECRQRFLLLICDFYEISKFHVSNTNLKTVFQKQMSILPWTLLAVFFS